MMQQQLSPRVRAMKPGAVPGPRAEVVRMGEGLDNLEDK
jgi:hypothetical protein